MNSPGVLLLLSLLLSLCFSVATLLQPRAAVWNKRAESGGVLKLLFGEGRRLFANQFFVQADISFHSGYYPSIFDQEAKPKDSSHMTEDVHEHEQAAGQGHEATNSGNKEAEDHEAQHEKEMAAFMGRPRDWVEGFGRHFIVTRHTHLAEGREREMLPWLKLSAEMDPQRIDTYTVAAFWLQKIGKLDEAEQFLRLGLRHNPESYELLFELGRLLEEQKHDYVRAANLWKLALKKWHEQEDGKKEQDRIGYEKLVVQLARNAEHQGNISEAISYLQMAIKTSPDPAAIRKLIQDLQTKAATKPDSKQR